MLRLEIDRDLLFGVIALRMDFIKREDLIAAIHGRAAEQGRTIDEILVDRGSLDEPSRAAIGPMVAVHVARHGGDPAASLEALTSIEGLMADLRRSADDTDVVDSLATVLPGETGHFSPSHSKVESRPTGARYKKVREHARGGLGIVFVARDEELNREVALKEIKGQHADHDYHRAKFLLEAEVTGGLEHPGIVPVYGLGHQDDGRPFYAMRFIRGDSLMETIQNFHAGFTRASERGERHLSLQKLLRRFTDVCNAIDYAHSRGILHRDLKPQNVMVGPYGETLVVDWGLAKAIGRSGDEGEVAVEDALVPSSGSGSDATLPGSVVGTPAYMSPEQAAGRLDLMGPASDIYSLGATLYHLLAGRAPFGGQPILDIIQRVQHGEFPRPRDAAPWLDPALEAICLKAMALEPKARYVTPRALAEDVECWVAGEPVAAYPEPFARRARRWAARHQTALATAGSAAVVAGLLLGGLAWSRFRQAQEVDRQARATLAQADGLAIEARAMGDLARWSEAIAEAHRADSQIEAGGGGEALHREVEAHLETYRVERDRRSNAIAAQERDRRMVRDLEEARLLQVKIRGDEFDAVAKHDEYFRLFKNYGIDLKALPADEAARRIRTSPIADDLLGALDDWSLDESTRIPFEDLAKVGLAAETDPVRRAGRQAFAANDAKALRELCIRLEDRRKLGPRLRSVFKALRLLDPAGSLALLEEIRRENPGDFWLNEDLGREYLETSPPRLQEAIRCLTAAVAIRPGSEGAHYMLGLAFRRRSENAAATAEYRRAIELKPEFAEAHNGLASALRDLGDPTSAIVASREAIRHRPGDAGAHLNLGLALVETGDLAAGIPEIREATQLRPNDAAAYLNLGLALERAGDYPAAVAAGREALRLNPDDPPTICSLGRDLGHVGEFRESLETLERGHALGSKQRNWNLPSARWVQDARRLLELDARLPAILKSEATPTDPDDRLALADLCARKGLPWASARFYEQAFAEKRAIANDLAANHRFDAACVASLAGCGKGKDDTLPDEAVRVRLRSQALEWLRAELEDLTKVARGSDETARKGVGLTLGRWKIIPDLAGIRDDGELAKWPETEREAFRTLWREVDALQARVR